MACALGAAVPPFTPHAISVSLPTWKDNIGYEEGEKRVVDAMVSGYPRFFIHLAIQKVHCDSSASRSAFLHMTQLARQCRQKFGSPGEDCMLFPSRKIADACRSFVTDQANKLGIDIPIRLVQYVISPENDSSASSSIELHIVLFPEDRFSIAKQFWQHTGLGVSSRLAERCLTMLQNQEQPPASPISPRIPTKASNRFYSAKPRRETEKDHVTDEFEDHATYLEERYGRNLPQDAAASAKRAMKRRIAGVLVRDSPSDWAQAGKQDAEIGPSTRGVDEVSEDDVFLYPTGMAAIWNTHQLALATRPPAISVCFG